MTSGVVSMTLFRSAGPRSRVQREVTVREVALDLDRLSHSVPRGIPSPTPRVSVAACAAAGERFLARPVARVLSPPARGRRASADVAYVRVRAPSGLVRNSSGCAANSLTATWDFAGLLAQAERWSAACARLHRAS